MNNIIDIKYEDLELLMQYLEKKAKGQPINLQITDLGLPKPRLKVKLTNNLHEDIEITIFCKDVSLMPKINWEDRLNNVL